MDLNSDTSSDEEVSIATVHAELSLSGAGTWEDMPRELKTTKTAASSADPWWHTKAAHTKVAKRRKISSSTLPRRSCRPRLSTDIYWAESAPNPRLLQAAARDEVGEERLRVSSVTLGSLIKVYWSGERRWFVGSVNDTRENGHGQRMHHVSYQDGDTKWHHLPSVRWLQVQFVAEEAAAEKEEEERDTRVDPGRKAAVADEQFECTVRPSGVVPGVGCNM